MSSIKLRVAVFAVSMASAAAGSALLTQGTALANAIRHCTPAQTESAQLSHARRGAPRLQPGTIRVSPDLRRGLRPALRKVKPVVRVQPDFRR